MVTIGHASRTPVHTGTTPVHTGIQPVSTVEGRTPVHTGTVGGFPPFRGGPHTSTGVPVSGVECGPTRVQAGRDNRWA